MPTSLELLNTKNSDFKEEYPNMVKKIMNKQLSDFEPKIDEIEKVYKIIKTYIIEKKRKIYGGYALNILLSSKDKKLSLYDEMDLKSADIDFYSPEPVVDLVSLCDKIYAEGFKPVVGQEAQHKETYSIFVNYRLYCDITYMPNNIYKKARFIQLDGYNIIHPWFMIIDYFRMFTDPMISYWRLEKHFERYMKVQRTYPLPLIQKPLYITPYKNNNIYNAMNIILDYLTEKDTILMTGFYVYNYYLYYSGYYKNNKNYNYIDMPYLEAYSINYIKDGLDILNFIKGLSKEIADKLTYKEYYPFFQFYGYNFVIYYEQIPILYFYSNNKRCIPFKKVPYVKFNKTNYEVIKNKEVNIGCFDHNILHSLIILVKVRVDDDNDWNDIIYKYINGLVTFRNYYLEKNKETIYSESIFQGFVIECMGETLAPDRERRLVIEARKKLGKPYVFKYDPSISKSPTKYNFMNSSGNQINKDIQLKLKEENLVKQLNDIFEAEEIDIDLDENNKNSDVNDEKN